MPEQRRQNRTFATAFATGRNNFDLMRLAAALLVLVSHAWVLTGHADAEPFARAMGHMIDGGGLAVALFFILSGFLIARSAQVHSPARYLLARALRIWPAFAVAVVSETFVLGLIFTTLTPNTYLTDADTWFGLVRTLVFSPTLGLPGVFADNPFPLAVNGSLWTLRIEILCYLGLLMLCRTGWLRPGWILLPLVCGWALLGSTLAARAGYLPPRLAPLHIVAVVDCGLDFLTGAALWVYADRIPHRTWLAVAAVTLLVLTAAVPATARAAPIALHLALPYVVLWIGLCRPILRRKIDDISYGTYLYAFPIQQAVVAVHLGVGPTGLVALAIPPTLLCALLSRKWIETPCLRFCRAR